MAQTSFGRIAGSVTDQTEAAIASAKVTISNMETKTTRTIQTDENGFYVVTNLPIGPYTVEVDPPGFKHQQRTGVNVGADSR